MPEESLMVKQVRFIIVVKRINTLGIALTVGMIAIYGMGLIVVNNNVIEDFEMINLLTLILLLSSLPLSLFVKKILLKKVNLSNFQNTYFTACVVPFSIIDFFSLFCLTTNLFVNGNILYATIGVIISVSAMVINFPKEEYFDKLK